MSWGSFCPSQILFFPFYTSAKTCWKPIRLIETGKKNQYSLNSSFLHLFKQCRLFSPAWLNSYINYIIFLPVHLVTIVWSKQYPKRNAMLFICSHLKKQVLIHNGIISASAGVPVQSMSYLFPSSAFQEVPSSYHFLESGLNTFSSKKVY